MSVDLGPEAGPPVPIVGGPRQHGREGVVAEGQDLEDGRLVRRFQARGRGIGRGIGASERFL